MENCEHWTKSKKVFAIIGMVLGGVVIAAVMALLLGFVVMWLWNWLMPAIFGLPTITFWQAWGLVVLAHILFKSFPHKNYHNHDGHWNQGERWNYGEHWKRKFQKKFFPGKDAETEPAE